MNSQNNGTILYDAIREHNNTSVPSQGSPRMSPVVNYGLEQGWHTCICSSLQQMHLSHVGNRTLILEEVVHMTG